MNSFKSLVKAISPFTSSSKNIKSKRNKSRKKIGTRNDSDGSDDSGNSDDSDDYDDDMRYKKHDSKRRLQGKYKKATNTTSNSSPSRYNYKPHHKHSTTNRNQYDNDTNIYDDIYSTYNWDIKGYRSGDIKYAVRLLYQQYNPSKLDTIDFIYDQWKGEDTLFLQNLCKRYRLKEKQMQEYLDEALLRNRRKSISSSSPAKSILSSSSPGSSKNARGSITFQDKDISNSDNEKYQTQQIPPSRVPPQPPQQPPQPPPITQQPPPPLIPQQTISSVAPSSLPEHLTIYTNMVKHGVPEQAVILKMNIDKIPPHDQDAVINSKVKQSESSMLDNPAPTTRPTAIKQNSDHKAVIDFNEIKKELKSTSPPAPAPSVRNVSDRHDSDRYPSKVIEKEVIVEKIIYKENDEKIQALKKELDDARKLYTSFEKLYREESEKRHAIEERKPKVIEKEVIVEKPIVVEKVVYVENEHKILALQHELEETKRLYQEESNRRATVNDDKINLLKTELEETRKHMLEASKESKQVIELLMKHGAIAVNGALSVNTKNKDNTNNEKVNSILELQMKDMKEELAKSQADRAEILKLLEVIAFSPVDTKMVLDSYLNKYSKSAGVLDPSAYNKQLNDTFGSKELQEVHKRFYSPSRQSAPKTPNSYQDTSTSSILSPQSSMDGTVNSNCWNLTNEINSENIDKSNIGSPINSNTLKEILIRDQYDLTKKYIQHGTIQAQTSQKLVRNNIALEALEMKQVLTDLSKKVKKDFEYTVNDWVEHIDPKTRRKYYYSKSRNKSTWNLPLEYSLSKPTSKSTTPTRFERSSSQSSRSSSPKTNSRSSSPKTNSRSSSPRNDSSNFLHKYTNVDLPPPKKKWQTATDSSSGRKYYYCKESNESKWSRPDDY